MRLEEIIPLSSSRAMAPLLSIHPTKLPIPLCSSVGLIPRAAPNRLRLVPISVLFISSPLGLVILFSAHSVATPAALSAFLRVLLAIRTPSNILRLPSRFCPANKCLSEWIAMDPTTGTTRFLILLSHQLAITFRPACP